MREYVVVLNKGVDYDQFWNEIENDSSTDGFVPSRRVEIVNNRDGSLRSCHYLLSAEEATTLQQDPRILSVEIPVDQRKDVEIGLFTSQNGNFNKPSQSDSSYPSSGSFVNWGLIRNSNTTNTYGTGLTNAVTYDYDADGTGVDVIIHDSGLQIDHPEFQDANGVSRVQPINWYTASGLTGTQSSNHYRDYDGHGTHVAGIAAGKTYGWAKNAKIYSIKVDGLEGSGDAGTGIPIYDCFDVIKLWHRNKPIDPTIGRKRPTIVNMSWGYGYPYIGITNGDYRGTQWTGNFADPAKGMISTYRSPRRIASIDSDLEELIDEGVIVCIAAGNSSHKIDVPGGVDYNNFWHINYSYYSGAQLITINEDVYYHRGSSPYSSKAIMVGALNAAPKDAAFDKKAEFSNAGPGVDIFAAGDQILSSTSNTNSYSSSTYFNNPAYKQLNLPGTSMASPQVCGIGATFLQKNLTATPAQFKTWLKANATPTLYKTASTNDYTNTESQYGGDTYVAYSNNKPASTGGGGGGTPTPTPSSPGVKIWKGDNGNAKVNFKRVPAKLQNEFINYGFEQGIVSWVVAKKQIHFLNNPLNVPPTVLAGFQTPADPTPNIYGSPGQTRAVPDSYFSYTFETNDKPPSGESKCLRLTLGDFGPTQSFGLVYGPAVYSDFAVPFKVGDTVKFWWKALPGSDAYNVYAYMVEQQTGTYINLLDATGINHTTGTSWSEVSTTLTPGTAGTYSFVFIAGSYDSTGGTVIGGELLLDNIQITRA
jgi:subtilisin family serine protease